jgi:hypothetical protein
VLAQNTGGFYSIGQQSLLESDAAGLPQANTLFTFNTPITAFGVYVIQGGDMANSNPTTFRLTNTVTSAFADVTIPIGPNWGSGNVFFLGVSDSSPFNQVEILETGDAADGMLYDNIVAGGAVPEPSSIALVLLGGAAALRRLRR